MPWSGSRLGGARLRWNQAGKCEGRNPKPEGRPKPEIQSVGAPQQHLKEQHAGRPHHRPPSEPRQVVFADERLHLEQQECAVENRHCIDEHRRWSLATFHVLPAQRNRDVDESARSQPKLPWGCRAHECRKRPTPAHFQFASIRAILGYLCSVMSPLAAVALRSNGASCKTSRAMRMKSCVIGLLAMLILASGSGCKKSASEGAPPNHLSTLNPQPSTLNPQPPWLVCIGWAGTTFQPDESRLLHEPLEHAGSCKTKPEPWDRLRAGDGW